MNKVELKDKYSFKTFLFLNKKIIYLNYLFQLIYNKFSKN